MNGPTAEELKAAFIDAGNKHRPSIRFTVSVEPHRLDIYVKGLIYVDKSFDKFMIIGEVTDVIFLEEWGLPDANVRIHYDSTLKKGRFLGGSSSSGKN
jgi:hypothetical protein